MHIVKTAPKRKLNSDIKAKVIVNAKFTKEEEISDARTIITRLDGKCKGIFKKHQDSAILTLEEENSLV